jgi:hypothetical protein
MQYHPMGTMSRTRVTISQHSHPTTSAELHTPLLRLFFLVFLMHISAEHFAVDWARQRVRCP